jgi:hypothetical protein
LLPDVFIKDHWQTFIERETERNVAAHAHIGSQFDFIAVDFQSAPSLPLSHLAHESNNSFPSLFSSVRREQ